MGRIKTAFIKRTAKELIEKYEFEKDFDKNKSILSEVVDISSKKIRNVLAGYITRLMKRGF